MSTGTYIHLTKPWRCETLALTESRCDALLVNDEGVDLTLYFGRTDEARAENALFLIEAIQTIRERALRRLVLAEEAVGAADPITAAKAEEDRIEADGATDWYRNQNSAGESVTYRLDMTDAGRGAMLR